MKTVAATSKSAKLALFVIGLIIVLIPFHAFLTVWLASLLGHYTALRLWKEFLLALLTGYAAFLLLKDTELRQKFGKNRLAQAIGLFLGLQLIWGVVAYALHGVTLKALGYGWIVDTRYLLFFMAVWIIGTKQSVTKNWTNWILWPALIVIIFGLLQYFVLPYDALKHVGYSQNTIYPYSTINHNLHYIRITSTLRGANPLGAYLLVIISLVAALWLQKKRLVYTALGVLAFMGLFLTFSRSALLGLVVSLALLFWLSLKTKRSRQITAIAGLVLCIVTIGAFVGLRHNAALQNAVFHTDDHSKIAISSNEGHASAFKAGFEDAIHHPLGEGPGSAGPASVYNRNRVKISENFFIQIAQETSVLGLLIFLAILLMLAKELWRRRTQPLALGLLASLTGLCIVNLLSHAWADDTLAYIWWGLAGMALAISFDKKKAHKLS